MNASHSVRRTLGLALLTSLIACSNSGGSGPNPGPGTGLNASILKSAAAGAGASYEGATAIASLSIDAVREASRQGTGGTQLRTFGTLTQTANNAYSYAANPTDRLVARLTDGRSIEFRVTSMNGDVAAGGIGFLRGNHDLDVRIDDGANDLTIRHRNQNRVTQGTVEGTIVIDNVPLRVDLQIQGTSFLDSSFGGLEYRLEETIRGTVMSGGMTSAVEEATRFEIVSANGNSASTSSRRASATWTIDGVNYEMRNLAVNRAFRNGRVNELDTVWRAEGQVLLNGQQVGTVRLANAGGTVNVVLDMAGQQIALERHQIR